MGKNALKVTSLQVADEATQRNLPYLSLMVTEDNLTARHLYDSNGFATERRQMTKAL